MSWSQVAATTACGLLFAVAIIVIARKGILSMRYTFGWLFIALCIVLGGALGGVVARIARAVDMDPFTLVVSIAAAALLALTVQLSITVSGLTERVRTLAEASAILEEELARLKDDRRPPAPATGDQTGASTLRK